MGKKVGEGISDHLEVGTQRRKRLKQVGCYRDGGRIWSRGGSCEALKLTASLAGVAFGFPEKCLLELGTGLKQMREGWRRLEKIYLL